VRTTNSCSGGRCADVGSSRCMCCFEFGVQLTSLGRRRLNFRHLQQAKQKRNRDERASTNKRVETTRHYDNHQQRLTDDIRFCTESASMLFSSSPLGSLSSRARRNARDFKKPKRQLQNAISRGTPHQQRHATLFKNSLVLTGRCATTSSLGRRCYKCVR
jgi:hypothetical protein